VNQQTPIDPVLDVIDHKDLITVKIYIAINEQHFKPKQV